MRVAIIGAGISDLSAAYGLHRARGHAVRRGVAGRRPRQDRHGRHGERSASGRHGSYRPRRRHVPHVPAADGRARCRDAGERYVPRLACRACGVEFSSRGARGWFAQPAAALRPGHWRMFADILRFYRDARSRLDGDVVSRATLRDYLESAGRSGVAGPLPDPHHVRGVVNRIDRILDFPVDLLLRFLDHHGLIGVGRALQWRTIVGGSMTYVERIIDRIGQDAVPAGDPVVDVARTELGVTVRTEGGSSDYCSMPSCLPPMPTMPCGSCTTSTPGNGPPSERSRTRKIAWSSIPIPP